MPAKEFWQNVLNRYAKEKERERKEKIEKIRKQFIIESEKELRIGPVFNPDDPKRRRGHDFENLTAYLIKRSSLFGKEAKVYLASKHDDGKYVDIIVYFPEENFLLAIDLTSNGDEEILFKKLSGNYRPGIEKRKILCLPKEIEKSGKKPELIIPLVLGVDYKGFEKLEEEFLEAYSENKIDLFLSNSFFKAFTLQLLRETKNQISDLVNIFPKEIKDKVEKVEEIFKKLFLEKIKETEKDKEIEEKIDLLKSHITTFLTEPNLAFQG